MVFLIDPQSNWGFYIAFSANKKVNIIPISELFQFCHRKSLQPTYFEEKIGIIPKGIDSAIASAF